MSAGFNPAGLELAAGLFARSSTTNALQDAAPGAGLAHTRAARCATPLADGDAAAVVAVRASGIAAVAITINLFTFT
jgi:hypothetical protein